ncbi:response regulator [Haloactinopolyspora alba]|uniref:response regulator n=1 Tax=Haloactinopolyspora alba TaxID=648780 RepID=UPI000D0DACF5|nr:response regulator transcription factor [Haloactinopolyspora alba]
MSGEPNPVRVALADDQVLVRAGFAALLASDPGTEVVGEAGDGAEAVDLVRRHRPDVVLMDIRMPGVDGIRATEQITADPALSATRVAMLTTFEIDEYVFAALVAGASGFLAKDLEPDELLRAVRVLAAGDALLSPGATRRLVAEYASRSRPGARGDALDELTTREREVTALLAVGLSNEEIAQRLFLSPATVKTHIGRALTKTGARDRVQLVVLAYESGLAQPGQQP